VTRRPSTIEPDARHLAAAHLVREDIESIRLEARVLAEVRRDWDAPGSSDT
jgi:hypothetical protein